MIVIPVQTMEEMPREHELLNVVNSSVRCSKQVIEHRRLTNASINDAYDLFEFV